MKTLTEDEARHYNGMPVHQCKCDGCARALESREEQQSKAFGAIRKLREAGAEFDQAYIEEQMKRCGVQWERN
jgi:hypothetical protein